jgi:hypothetical protein
MEWNTTQDIAMNSNQNKELKRDDEQYEYVIPLWHAVLLVLQLAQLALLIVLLVRA